MAVGKFQPFVQNDSIYAMDTETGKLFRFNHDRDYEGGKECVGWEKIYGDEKIQGE